MNLKGFTISQVKKDVAEGKYSYDELISEASKLIDELDPKIHAFVSRVEVNEVKAGEGPLGGIPASLKDNYNWKGTITTASSKILENYKSPYDATVTERLLKAGAKPTWTHLHMGVVLKLQTFSQL